MIYEHPRCRSGKLVCVRKWTAEATRQTTRRQQSDSRRSGSSSIFQDDFENCPAYLTRAVRNLALNHLRDTTRKSEVALPEFDFNAISDPAPSPEAAAIYRNELRRLLEAVAALPARRREVFVLNKFEGLSYDEIAARQGVSRNTVITQIVSALAGLNQRLEQK